MFDQRRAFARHPRARHDEVEARASAAAAGVDVDVRVDAERARRAELAVSSQTFDDGDAVELLAAEVHDQHARRRPGAHVGAAA